MASTIVKLRKFPSTIKAKSESVSNRAIYLSYSLELSLFIEMNQYEKAINLSIEIEEKIKRSELIVPSEQSEFFIYYNTARAYFGIKNYTKTKLYLNKIINNKNYNFRSDIACYARILNLIVYYELKDDEYIRYAVKSTYSFLTKRKRLFEIETVLLNFLTKKMPKIFSKKEEITAFRELKVDIEKVLKDPFERQILLYFDFIAWLESKINQ